MNDIFAEVNKQLKESKERWIEIDKLSKELKDIKAAPFAKDTDTKIISLLLMLVEQLRPLQASMGQAEDMQGEINNMLVEIAKMAKK